MKDCKKCVFWDGKCALHERERQENHWHYCRDYEEPDELDEDMRDCGGCQCWDGDDGICHHPAHLGQVMQNGCEHKEG